MKVLKRAKAGRRKKAAAHKIIQRSESKKQMRRWRRTQIDGATVRREIKAQTEAVRAEVGTRGGRVKPQTHL